MKRITALLLTFLLLCSLTFASATSIEAYVFGLTVEKQLLGEIGRPIARQEQPSLPGVTLVVYDLESRIIALAYNDELIMWMMTETEIITWTMVFAKLAVELELNEVVFVISKDQLQKVADSLQPNK